MAQEDLNFFRKFRSDRAKVLEPVHRSVTLPLLETNHGLFDAVLMPLYYRINLIDHQLSISPEDVSLYNLGMLLAKIIVQICNGPKEETKHE